MHRNYVNQCLTRTSDGSEMKKIFRSSQMKDIIGPSVHGLRMHRYGLPFRNGAGFIFPDDEDLVDLMLIAVEKHPELHVVTWLDETKEFKMLNRFETENAHAYQLHTGNADPDIEFIDKVSIDDWTPEEIEGSQRRLERLLRREFTVVELAALNYSLHAKIKKDCKDS